MRKKKVLFVATVVKTHIMTFHIPFLRMLQEMGYETAVAARNDYENPEECKIPYCDTYYNIPFERFPLKKQNIKAYNQLKKIIEDNRFDIIHCHTPVGGLLGRLCSIKARTQGTRVFYTAHGFHFYKGAPLKNWLFYYPIEKLCSRWTDVLITINREDYTLAQKKMKAKQVEYVPGVGIDMEKFQGNSENTDSVRKQLCIPEGMFWALNVGELIPRKNQKLLIQAAAEIDNLYLTLVGKGQLNDSLLAYIRELHVEDRVKLLGYRTDIADLCSACDFFVFPSLQEGLPVAVMEAMASGLPCAVSRIRGNTDLIDENGGVFFDPSSAEDLKKALLQIQESDLTSLGAYNKEKVKNFRLENILQLMRNIYLQNH